MTATAAQLLSPIAGIAVLVMLLPVAAPAEGAPATEDEKAIYALGALQARQLKSLQISHAELEQYLQGVRDAYMGETSVDPVQYRDQIRVLQRERGRAAVAEEKIAAAAFVKQSSQEQGVEVTESGLVFKEVREGLGDSPTIVDTVEVHYHGTLRDGSVFDSSVARGSPVKFPLNGVIQCWGEALQKMKVGGKAELVCPPGLAYGDRGAGGILPGAALKFAVELIAIEKK